MRMYQCLTPVSIKIQLHVSILSYFFKISQINEKSLKIKFI
ncbi:MAG: hypothetical protein AWM53_00310 [Candidatus Dichloromethanomonas elyunquensis]|nr:MAG: hypothetical protein AWM53_00310 [Candidatus Dichloromethanomonas elyunquensis]